MGAWWQLSRVGSAKRRYGVGTSRPRTLRASVGVAHFHILHYVPHVARMLSVSRTDRGVYLSTTVRLPECEILFKAQRCALVHSIDFKPHSLRCESNFLHYYMYNTQAELPNTTFRFCEGHVAAHPAVAQWLRCCATNRKVAGSIPDGVIGIFH